MYASGCVHSLEVCCASHTLRISWVAGSCSMYCRSCIVLHSCLSRCVQDRIYSQSGTGGGAFAANASVDINGSIDFSGEGNFLTDVVGASVDILESLDSMDLGDHGSDWYVLHCMSSAHVCVPELLVCLY